MAFEYEFIINTATEATIGGWKLSVLSTNYTRGKFTFAQI